MCIILVELRKNAVSHISEVSDERNDQFRLTYLVTRKQETKPRKKIKHEFKVYLNFAASNIVAVDWGMTQELLGLDIAQDIYTSHQGVQRTLPDAPAQRLLLLKKQHE